MRGIKRATDRKHEDSDREGGYYASSNATY